MAQVTLKGTPVRTFGELPKVGSLAPDFILVDGDLHNRSFQDFAGKKLLLSIVPSLDTAVCSTMAKKFNEAAKRFPKVAFLVISADLPFAQKRKCQEEHIANITTLSMMRSKEFGEKYGTLLTDGPLAGINARAVLVLDENHKVLYSELVSEITQEPNYDKALAYLE